MIISFIAVQRLNLLKEELELIMLTPFNIVVFIIGLVFLLGMLTFIAGVLILAFRSSSSDIKMLVSNTAKLAQKGIAENVAGLVVMPPNWWMR